MWICIWAYHYTNLQNTECSVQIKWITSMNIFIIIIILSILELDSCSPHPCPLYGREENKNHKILCVPQKKEIWFEQTWGSKHSAYISINKAFCLIKHWAWGNDNTKYTNMHTCAHTQSSSVLPQTHGHTTHICEHKQSYNFQQ